MNDKKTSNSQLFIIILNWNQLKDTTECIESILEQTYRDFQIVVVDNGSTDNSAILLKQSFPNIKMIENGKNMGYQGGVNIGIKYALMTGAKYLLILNNDTILDKDMIKKLIENFPDEAGIVSPIMYYFENPSEVWSLGGDIHPVLIEIWKSQKIKARKISGLIERDFIPSCAWLVRRDVFNKIGLLDESFFPIYYDDLDFCLRARRNGFRLFINPNAKLWHKVSASSGGEYNPRERYLMARNSGYYFRKNMRFWQAPFIIVYRCGSALLWSGRLIKGKKYIALKEYWKGLIKGWFGKIS